MLARELLILEDQDLRPATGLKKAKFGGFRGETGNFKDRIAGARFMRSPITSHECRSRTVAR